jgi:hypothetical protein
MVLRDAEDAKMKRAFELYDSQARVREVAEELNVSRSAAGRMRQKWELSVLCPTVLQYRNGTAGQARIR